MLAQALAMFDSLAERILECDAKTGALLVPLGRHDVQLAGPDKKRQKNAPGSTRVPRSRAGRAWA